MQRLDSNPTAILAAVSAAVFFIYYSVLTKLGADWWSDENYSHGLLVPFVIAIILWAERDRFARLSASGSRWTGAATVAFAFLMLAGGTLGAELFTQRISLAVMIMGVCIYFFGRRVLSLITVPLALLVLAIPIPQIVFNRIAFPLQIKASQIAVWGIRLFEVPSVRNGNVIDILPRGSTQPISLQVVEACSGIRSLMTLVTLALILGYFTRRSGRSGTSRRDVVRIVLLMVSAVPIAVLTNAARVTFTGVLTYHYGKWATDAAAHDISGWMVYVVALALLIVTNFVLLRVLPAGESETPEPKPVRTGRSLSPALPLIAALFVGGAVINWYATRPEAAIERLSLAELPAELGDWQQRGADIRFDEGVEDILRATDYTMREYTDPSGRVANIYVGYYASQRTGATYHSPQNCLPGAGWVLSEPEIIEFLTPAGRKIRANKYIIENGVYREAMIYWYEGRGRTESDEYRDKLHTIIDGVIRSRTDGALIRVMTSVGEDEKAGADAAIELASQLDDQLTPFIPN